MEALKFFVAILPIFILAVYIYIHDKEKEPTSLLVMSFVCGMLICIPCIFVENTLSNVFSFLSGSLIKNLLYIILCIGFVEEGYKFLTTFLITRNNKEVNYTFDPIVYSTFVALGFAFFENIIYLRSVELTSMVLRAFTAVPVHISCGILMGYFLSLSKQPKQNVIKNLFLSCFTPTFIHSLYNFYLVYVANVIRLNFDKASSNQIIYTLLILILAVLFLTSNYVLSTSAERDKKIKRNVK